MYYYTAKAEGGIQTMSDRVKIFIDGSEGTTGLRIHERFERIDDIRLLSIDPKLRKDREERRRLFYLKPSWPDWDKYKMINIILRSTLVLKLIQ